MTNRFQAPGARVADSDTATRPRSINVALVLIGLLVLVESYHQAMSLYQVNVGEMSVLGWLVEWIWVVAIVVAGIFIARGRNWARWVLGIITMREIYEYLDARLFLSAFGAGAREFFDPFSLWILPMSAVCAVAATILNFGPGRGWFR